MIHVRLLYRMTLAIGIPLAVAGCGGSGDDVAALRDEVAALRRTQAEMQTTIATMQRTRADSAAAAPAAKRAIQPAAPGQAAKPRPVFRIPVGGSPRRGNELGPVTVVQFADFQSPAAKASAGLPQELLDAHPDKVQFVFKYYPLPRFAGSREVAKAAWAAQQQGKFWEMRDLIYAGAADSATPETLRGYAQGLGLDMARFVADMASPKADEALAADRQLMRTMRVGPVPAYFVNGRRVAERSPAAVRAAVAEQIARSTQQPAS